MTYCMFFYRFQKRAALNWPQELPGTTKVVELYVVNDYSQVRSHKVLFLYTFHIHNAEMLQDIGIDLHPQQRLRRRHLTAKLT
jgi:hypothetical protein